MGRKSRKIVMFQADFDPVAFGHDISTSSAILVMKLTEHSMHILLSIKVPPECRQ